MVLLIKKNNEEKKTIETDFILSHNLYAKAEVPPTDKVCLWLGANVMLEYSNEEAEELLNKNLTQANASLEQTNIDLDFLKFVFIYFKIRINFSKLFFFCNRDQITTTEVNMARVYNWDVKRRQGLKPQ